MSSRDACLYADRREAGRALAAALDHLRDNDPIVLALPRGGVPVGFEVARHLEAPLDVLLVRKVGAPGQPEFGLGAVVDAQPEPQLVLDDAIVRLVAPPPGYVEAEVARQVVAIEARRALYAMDRVPLSPEGRTVILVDDGAATGGTARAALRGLRRQNPANLILAIPVAPTETLDDLRPEADEIVCPCIPPAFRAVGLHYRDFGQTEDEEVLRLLRDARLPPGPS